MATTIDNRVVEMRFINKQFEKGIESTVESLGTLNKSLRLDDISMNAKLDGIGAAVDSIASKFTGLGVVGFTAIQAITKGLGNAAKELMGNVLDPLIAGGKKRSLAIEQAKFQFKGLGMNVEKAMDSSLKAVKGTAFGLDEAATAAAMFGASGIKAGKNMTSALRGIAGVAAMSGSGFADIADVFTKVAGQGRLMGDDLNRLASRGVNAAATLGKSMGKTEAEIRAMVSKGKISFKMFAAGMDEAFGKHATKASETYTGALSNLRAAFARIGARYFTNQFEALRRVFNGLTPVIDKIAEALAPLSDLLGKLMIDNAKRFAKFLKTLDFKDANKKIEPLLGALEDINVAAKVIFSGLKNAFKASLAVLKPFTDAFKEVFPWEYFKRGLMEFALAFISFTKKLMPSQTTLDAMTETWKALLLTIKLGIGFVGKLVGVITNVIGYLYKVLKGPSAALMDTLGGYAEKYYDFMTALNLGGKVTKLHNMIMAEFGDEFKSAHEFIMDISDAITDFIRGLKPLDSILSDVSDSTDGMGESLGEMAEIVKSKAQIAGEAFKNMVGGQIAAAVATVKLVISEVSAAMERFTNASSDMGGSISGGFRTTLGAMGAGLKALSPIVDAVKSAFSIFTWDGLNEVVDFIMSLVTGKFLWSLSNLFDGIANIGKIGTGITESLDAVTGSLESLQKQIIAKAIKEIAIALGILVLSIWLLSTIDPAGLGRGLSAVVLLLTVIGAMMWAIKTIDASGANTMQVGAALITLAAAIFILAIAVRLLSGVDPDKMAQGLIGVSVILGALFLFTKFFQTSKLSKAAVRNIIVLSAAVLILSVALKLLSTIDADQMIVALFGLLGVLGAVFAFMKYFETSKFSKAAAANLVTLSIGIAIMAVALKILGTMSWEEIARAMASLAGIAVALMVILRTIKPEAVGQAALLVAVSVAVLIAALALAFLGNMQWETVVKGVIVMGAILTIIAYFLREMTDPDLVKGAGALILVSVALIILSGAILLLGSIPIETITKGLFVIVGVLMSLGIAAYLLSGHSATLYGIALAIIAIGAAVLLAGVGISAIILSLSVLLTVLTVGGRLLIAYMIIFSEALIVIAANVVKAMAAFALELVAQAQAFFKVLVVFLLIVIQAVKAVLPALFELISVFITELINLIIAKVPEIVNLISVLFTAIIDLTTEYIPKIIDAVLEILVGIMTAINKNLPKIIRLAGEIAVSFINGLADNHTKITNAGGDFIVKMIRGIGKNMLKITEAAMETVIEFIDGLAKAIRKNGPAFDTAANDLISAVWDRIKALLNTAAFNFANIGGDIASGIAKGIKDGIYKVGNAIKTLVTNAFARGKEESQSKSPSRLFMKIGKWWIEGIVFALQKNTSDVLNAAGAVVATAYSAMERAGDAALDVFDGVVSPTITPVIDLDNVYAGAKKISALMSDTSALKTTSMISAGVNGMFSGAVSGTDASSVNATPVGTTFIQNNYSPKALSRLEIYRQTQNQLRPLRRIGVST